LGFVSYGFAARAQDVVLVANRNRQISEISTVDLHAIFARARTRFADSSHALPAILKGGPIHEVFLKKHLDEGPDEFRALSRRVSSRDRAPYPDIRFRIHSAGIGCASPARSAM